jgi:TPP-dependent pyruvate/acetoin dehydrogenase alpha subunit
LNEKKTEQLEQLYRLLCQSRYTQQILLDNHMLGYSEIGEEAITIGAVAGLRADDLVSVYFRADHSQIKYKLNMSVADHLAYIMDKKVKPDEIPPEGFCYPDKGLMGKPASCIGCDVDFGTGAALAQKVTGSKKVVLVYSGDGALSKGNYYECYNFAAIHKLPIIFAVRHNHWAMSTPLKRDLKFEQAAQLADAFGIKNKIIDGNDILAVRDTVAEAAEILRAGEGPYLIECMTYRVSPHSAHDEDDYYRDQAVIAEWKKKDPIVKMEKHLADAGFGGDQIARIKDEVIKDVESSFARVSALPGLTTEEKLGRQETAVNKMLRRV